MTSVFAKLLKLNLDDSIGELKKVDVLLFCHDNDRGLDLQGCAYSPLLDSVREDLERDGLKCASVAHPWSVLTRERGFGSPVAMNRSYLVAAIAGRALRLFGSGSLYSRCDPVVRLYKTILGRAKPRLVISIGAPGALCRASRSEKVFHVELLHGIGYSLLPWGWQNKDTLDLPQGILSLDDISTETFRLLNQRGIEVVTIPHPFLKRFFSSNSGGLPSAWCGIRAPEKYLKQILVSMTWGYAGDHGEYTEMKGIINNGLFPDCLEEIVRETKETVFWRFRFHPVQIRSGKYSAQIEYMDQFVKENCNSEWKSSSSLPFPVVVMGCDGNLTMSSMACYDAAYMGVPSLVLCPTVQDGGRFQDYFQDLVGHGFVVKKPIGPDVIRDWVFFTKRKSPLLNALDDPTRWDDAVRWMLDKGGLGTCSR